MDLSLSFRIQDLYTEFNWTMDGSNPWLIAEFFTENGTMMFPGQSLLGKQAIYNYYHDVEKNTKIVVRHSWSNFQIISASSKKIEAKVLMQSLIGDGIPPITPNGFRMGDSHDVISVGAEGCLLFESRHFEMIFQYN